MRIVVTVKKNAISNMRGTFSNFIREILLLNHFGRAYSIYVWLVQLENYDQNYDGEEKECPEKKIPIIKHRVPSYA
jgi:hypothetical protein